MEGTSAMTCGNLFGVSGTTEIVVDGSMRSKGNLYRLQGGAASYLEAHPEGLPEALGHACAMVGLSAEVRYADRLGLPRSRRFGEIILLPSVAGLGFLEPARETWASGGVDVTARNPEPFCGVVRSPIAKSNTVTCVPLARAVEAAATALVAELEPRADDQWLLDVQLKLRCEVMDRAALGALGREFGLDGERALAQLAGSAETFLERLRHQMPCPAGVLLDENSQELVGRAQEAKTATVAIEVTREARGPAAPMR